VPFESLGAISYLPSIVTMTVSVAVCEIFSVKEWCDLENRVKLRSRSLEMAPFDRCLMLVKLELLGYRMVKKNYDNNYYVKP